MDPESSTTCHECGSSITNADSFCPFCGISLQAVAVSNDVVDDSMESTIMMSPSEALKLAGQETQASEAAGDQPFSESVANDTAADAPAMEASAVEEPAPEVKDSLESEEIPAAEADIDDVPVPSILSVSGQTDGSIRTPRTSEYSDEEIKHDLVHEDTLSGTVTAEETEAHAPQPDAEPAMPEVQAAAATPEPEVGLDLDDTLADAEIPAGSAVLKASASDDEFPPAEVPPAEAAPPSAELDTENAALAAVETEPIEESPVEDAAATENATTGPTEEPHAEEDAGISMPGDDLSQFDGDQSQPIFDSVRIMEPTGLSSDENVDTRLHPSTLSGQRKPLAVPEVVQPVGPDEPAEVLSSTSHNIGMVDTDGKKGAKLKPLTEGTLLHGRYEIIRKIGGGGMGAVYLASDNNLGGVLRAVKEMVQTHIEENQQEKAINDFKRESMILSSLDHVSIPTIYDYFYEEEEGRFYLVMKYISGGDLSSRIRAATEGRIDERTVCEWAVQIIDVLDYLHNQPSTIVYRDLKPSNIMIDGNSGRAMLIDFGIARSISQKEEKGVTAVGTMGYAPPELFSGNVEPRSDIYSLGSTMFHLLTGADPQSNPLLIFDFQKNPRPRQINPQLSDQIERILMRAVQYNAEDRFKSASEMRDVLEDHLLKLKAGIVTFGVSEVPASVSLAHQSVFCGFCGQRIVATDMFCAFCGAKQPIAQQGVHSEIYSPGAMTARLVVEGTSELTAPAYSLLKDENLLGRRDPMSNIFPEVDLSKYDPQTKISRRHARIWRDGTNFLLEDLGSSNGTILTKASSESIRLVPKQPQVLAAGDRIRVGDATLHFVIG
ncbi:MAG: protein kinase [Chloracidobacterium sp.]|nr:protein kinase [Chloracidobacterium sp.]